MTATKFTLGQCDASCHPTRYTVVTEQIKHPTNWWRPAHVAHRWHIRDNHLGRNIPRLCDSRASAEGWRATLERVSDMERIAHRQSPFGEENMRTTVKDVDGDPVHIEPTEPGRVSMEADSQTGTAFMDFEPAKARELAAALLQAADDVEETDVRSSN